MTVHRVAPLPTGPARGKLVVASQAVEATRRILAAAGARKPAHEGMAWWLGRQIGNDLVVMSAVAPTVDSGPQHVVADEVSVGEAAVAARALRLGIVAQVHSHPGGDTRHSDGDDQLILMPFEGMYSIVVAGYGSGDILPVGGSGVHQYQDHRWVLLTDAVNAVVEVPGQVSP